MFVKTIKIKKKTKQKKNKKNNAFSKTTIMQTLLDNFNFGPLMMLY